MKLRILDNSLRLRLSQSEVTQLRTDKSVRSTINFPGQTVLHYQVRHTEEVDEIRADFSSSEITLTIPTAQVISWADSNAVSIRAGNQLADGQTLAVLLEKDFKCLTTRENEDESDLFPHPKEGEVEC